MRMTSLKSVCVGFYAKKGISPYRICFGSDLPINAYINTLQWLSLRTCNNTRDREALYIHIIFKTQPFMVNNNNGFFVFKNNFSLIIKTCHIKLIFSTGYIHKVISSLFISYVIAQIFFLQQRLDFLHFTIIRNLFYLLRVQVDMDVLEEEVFIFKLSSDMIAFDLDLS